MENFTITATARSYPTLPYEQMKNDILGPEYRLSLVFVGQRRAQQLNKTYRNKDYIPNVLTFPLSPTDGEVFITPTIARTQAKNFGLTIRGTVGLLFIHALLHLKGMDHGDTMEEAEETYLTQYNLH